MARWLNTKTLVGALFGVAFGVSNAVMLGPVFGLSMGLAVGLTWAVVFNSSRTATGGPETDKDAD